MNGVRCIRLHTCAAVRYPGVHEQDMLEHPLLPAERAVALLLPPARRPKMVALAAARHEEQTVASRSEPLPCSAGPRRASCSGAPCASQQVALRAQLQEKARRQPRRRHLGSRRHAINILSPSTRSPRWTPSRELMRALYWTLRSTTTGPLVILLSTNACTVHIKLRAPGSCSLLQSV